MKLLFFSMYFINSMKESYEHLARSKFTEDGIRQRFLRLKERERYEYLGLPMTKSKRYFIADIYTVEQALERGIKFRREWLEPLPNVERKYWSKFVFSQKDDWVVTEYPTPDGEYWVMQVLWRNINQRIPYVRTATGSYSPREKYSKPFDGADLKYHFRLSINPFYSGNQKLTQRQELLVVFMANLIMRLGIFNKNVVALAYRSAYGRSATFHIIAAIMRSNKIMSRVAKELAEKLKAKEMDADFVLKQFKDMAVNEYDADPQRRERILRLIAAWNDIPAYESQILSPGQGIGQLGDPETINDLKMLEAGEMDD